MTAPDGGQASPIDTVKAFVAERPRLMDWASTKSDDDIADYQATKNATSIDGLPAVAVPARD